MLWTTIHAVSFFSRVLQYRTFLENCNVYYNGPSERLAEDYSLMRITHLHVGAFLYLFDKACTSINISDLLQSFYHFYGLSLYIFHLHQKYIF